MPPPFKTVNYFRTRQAVLDIYNLVSRKARISKETFSCFTSVE